MINDSNDFFPDRKKLKENISYDNIIEDVKKIDVNDITFENEDFIPRTEIKQKQKVYFWIRVFLKEESTLDTNQDITIHWLEGDEKLVAKFICFQKKGMSFNQEEQITNYNNEDDKKVLCLMIEEERININNQDIPFLKTLFRIGRHYQNQIWRKDSMKLTSEDGSELDWFDIEF